MKKLNKHDKMNITLLNKYITKKMSKFNKQKDTTIVYKNYEVKFVESIFDKLNLDTELNDR